MFILMHLVGWNFEFSKGGDDEFAIRVAITKPQCCFSIQLFMLY